MSAETEIAQLQAALAALEAQRSLLGDAVVDAAVGPIRDSLAALYARARAGQQRKQATVLFADVYGFTTLSETMDAEDVASIINELWAVVDRAILDHGGYIDKHIGDAVMAVWGARDAREDDPERAVRAALAMQMAVAHFCQTHHAPLALRIGINTGPVILGPVGTTGEFTAMGDAVNLASRLEHAAPVGGILISHDTYRHVRGIFDVQPPAPLTVKGKAEPVQTYIVLRAKPRAFRMATRGVEGIETRMVGREAELDALRQAFTDAVGASQTCVATVIGEAGVGKSRLLYEFDNWIELRPEEITYFKGRGTPNTQHVPYSLFRDLFALRFDILDSDSAAVALEKFQAGMAGFLDPDHAAIAGHWLGFDFSASEAAGRLLGTAGFAQAAQAYLTRYFRRVVAEGPAVVFLEDIHWADDPSLDLTQHLVAALPAAPLLVVALARPAFFERRRGWGEDSAAFRAVRLSPLSREAARALVDEILQRADAIPASLRDLIVNSAEGNPFYVEELVKMLIEQGVIERGMRNEELGIRNEERGSGGAGEQGGKEPPGGVAFSPAPLPPGSTALEARWTVRTDRLAALKVPATL
ncbi:MAG TPA: adenylate/guanylate cyclase domain-containing protein, partial [Promineifilum sp.]|nr:adenylate/guanylate cyclase domain-containing protein [Promineifilum sp.]